MERSTALKLVLCLSPLAAAAAYPGLGALGSFAIVLLSLAFNRTIRSAVLQMIDTSWGRTLALGLGGGIAIAIVGRLLAISLRELFGIEIDLSDFAEVEGNLRAYLILLAVGIGVGGILEELTFRGFVVGWGTALLGERAQVWLVLLSASVFGFAHLYQGWAGVITTGVIGGLIGFLYLYANRKLLVAMLAHATVNIIGVTSIYLGFT